MRLVARLGALCGVFALVMLVPGCPPVVPPCTADADCDDSNGCTTDACDVDAGTCSNEAACDEDHCVTVSNAEDTVTVCVECLNDAECDDDDACNGAETCVTGTCTDGTACVVDDGNECTTDACDPATGCSNTNVADGTACADDGNDCTGDVCTAGACTHDNAADGLACDDTDACTGGDVCAEGACVGTAIDGCCETDADCAAGDVCTDNVCETPTPACTLNTDCDDENPCTDDTCTDGACVTTNNTAPCNDANACTNSDVCGGGVCAGTAVTCPTGQACNSTGNCGPIVCTSNTDCNDNKGCTADVCNLASGNCEYTNVDAACNDGNFCSGTWDCDPTNEDANANGCVSTGNPCVNPTPVCNEATNACQACTTNTECNDNVPCTSDTCAAGSCNNAAVNANCPNPSKCDGIDTCNPANPDADSNGCVQPGNPCAPKLCVEATYVVGDPNTCTNCTSNAECTDNVTCTSDLCNGATGACSHTNSNTLCPDTAFCDGDDICNPADPDANAATGCTNGLEVTYPCANACNENLNACFACTSNADCNDNITCTTDTCNGGTGACTHLDNCAVGDCNLQSGVCE